MPGEDGAMLVTTEAKETSEKLLTVREVADRLLVTGLMVRRWLTREETAL